MFKFRCSRLSILIIAILFCITNIFFIFRYKVFADNTNVTTNTLWPRPIIVPLPDTVNGMSSPVIKLNGTWKFTTNMPNEFWKDSVDPSAWSDVTVPGDLEVQGFKIESNVEYPYKKNVEIPSDFEGKKVLLRVEGGYDYARVWVNGNLVRDHYGAFTTWDCDISNFVTPGKSAWVTIGLKALPEATEAIEYRHTRGLVRDISLIALPKDNLTRLQYNTDFDANFVNSTLQVTAAMEFHSASNAQVNISLKDPQGSNVSINPAILTLSALTTETTINIPITAPEKWDSEHPNLYTLTANVVVEGTTVETLIRKIGFRKVTWSGNIMYVNGQEIKLRGINWHQNDPLLGEAANDTKDEETLRLIKQANINFIRTSHYPQTQKVLDLCDEIGLYVLEETSVFFIDVQGVAVGSQSNPQFAARYMNQFSEMIEKDRSHASIIIWSLGNESTWGTNMQKEYDYVRMEDPLRPTIWSYPGVYDTGTTPKYEIYSVHYPSTGSTFGGLQVPQLMDEYAHIPCNNMEEFKFDPSIRDYYGEQLKYLWENMYSSKGCLGGAIWFSQDTLFPKQDGTYSGMADWGIVDIWNRVKPEWWNVKKEYSPVKIDKKYLVNPGKGKVLNIPVQNRYNHTNLNEINMKWSVGQSSGTVTGPNLAPGGNKGNITIPGRGWMPGDVVNLKIYKGSEYVDEYNFTIGKPIISFQGLQESAPLTTEDTNKITVNGSDFSVVFDKSTGMINSGTYQGSKVITGGPYLNLGITKLEAWSLSAITQSTLNNKVAINISGSYGNLPVNFVVQIDGTGLISTTYTINGTPPSGYTEAGIAYDVTSAVDKMTYKRDGTWTAYPDDYLDKNEGTAYKTKTSGKDTYRVKPTWAWSQDEADYFHFGSIDTGAHGTAEFRSSKRNAYFASLVLANSNSRLKFEGDGTGSVRTAIKEDGNLRFNMNNLWGNGVLPTYHQISKTINIPSGYSNTINMRLTDKDNFNETYEEVSFTTDGLATASSDRAGEEASKAIDGDTNTQWASIDTMVNCDQWLKVDLGSEKTFNSWTVRNTGEDGNAANTRDYSLEYSSDGTNWKRADAVVGNTSKITDRSFQTSITARYVRLHVTKCSADGMLWPAVRIVEFALYNKENVLPQANLVLGGIVTASTDRTGEEAIKGVDGSTDTQWASQDTTVSCDEWLKVDLGSEKTFDRWKVTNTGTDGNANITREYSLEYSSDGITWNMADAVKGNTLKITDRILASGLTARYVRIHITKCCADGVEWPVARIVEFELYNTSAGVDKTALDSTISKVIAMNNTDSCYTTDSWSLLQAALTAAQTISNGVNSGTETQAQVNSATGNLNNAIANLRILSPSVDIDPLAGSVNTGKKVQLSCSVTNTIIYYTINGTDPGASSTLYSLPITITESTKTIKAIAIRSSDSVVSNIMTWTYTIQKSNLITGSSVMANSDRAGEEASKAIDGDTNTQWASQDTTVNCDIWLKVDLGITKTFNRWTVTNTGADGNDYITSVYKLEYSSDGINWSIADTVSGNTKKVTDLTLASGLTARYVRLHVTKCCADGAAWPAVRIVEFELYNTMVVEPTTPDTTSATVAVGITSVVAPEKDATSLILPTVPEGYTIAIKSATSAISTIALNGTVAPPKEDTTVALIFTVTKTADNSTADTSSINVIVPAKTKSSEVLGIPGKPVLADNNGQANGIMGGTYNITMNLWWGVNGDQYKLYEDGVLIDTKSLIPNSPNAQTTVTLVSRKQNGIHQYYCELINDKGTTTSDIITVKVTDALPGKLVLSNDNWDGDGNYKLISNMWWGTNGNVYKLYENGVLIDTQTLNINSPQAQATVTNISDRKIGPYNYYCEFINDAGVTTSNTIDVKVIK